MLVDCVNEAVFLGEFESGCLPLDDGMDYRSLLGVRCVAVGYPCTVEFLGSLEVVWECGFRCKARQVRRLVWNERGAEKMVVAVNF